MGGVYSITHIYKQKVYIHTLENISHIKPHTNDPISKDSILCIYGSKQSLSLCSVILQVRGTRRTRSARS